MTRVPTQKELEERLEMLEDAQEQLSEAIELVEEAVKNTEIENIGHTESKFLESHKQEFGSGNKNVS